MRTGAGVVATGVVVIRVVVAGVVVATVLVVVLFFIGAVVATGGVAGVVATEGAAVVGPAPPPGQVAPFRSASMHEFSYISVSRTPSGMLVGL